MRNIAVSDPRTAGVACRTPRSRGGLELHRTLDRLPRRIDAGSFTTTAIATGIAPDGSALDPSQLDRHRREHRDLRPGCRTAVTSPGFSATGDVLTFADVVTNTGATTLHGITVTDDHSYGVGVTCPQSTLPPGASVTCTGSYAVTRRRGHPRGADDGDRSAVDPQAAVVSASPAELTIQSGTLSSVALSPTALSPGFGAAGDVIALRYVVTNTGATQVHGIGVTDDHVAGADLSCPPGQLMPARSQTCTGTYVVTQPDVDRGRIDLGSTASASDPFGLTVESAPASVEVLGRSVGEIPWHLRPRSAGPARPATPSATATWSPTPGRSRCTPCRCRTTTWPRSTSRVRLLASPNQSQACSGTYTVTQGDVDAGSIPTRPRRWRSSRTALRSARRRWV